MRKQTYLLIVTLAASLLLSGCVSVLPGLVEAWFTIAEVETTGPTTPIEETELGPEAAQVAERVRERAAQDRQADAATVEIVSVERTEWSDSCLGLGGPAESCAFVITPGYRVVVEVEGTEYAYRTDLTGDAIRAEDGMVEDPSGETEPTMIVRQMLMQQLQANFDEIEIVEVEQTEWPGGCLGLPAENEMCTMAIVPGYRVVLAVNGAEYVFRTDLDGSVIRLESAPEAQIGESVIEWRSPEDQICNVAQIGTEGVAFGLCGGPLMGGRVGMPERLDELAEFRSTFAPFKADTPAGSVSFSGEGDEEATPAQQRMIAEWARLVQMEAAAGRSGASWGLAFAWHREGGIAGFCDDLTVYVTGIAYATSCAGNEPTNLGQIRLDADQLAQVYDWVDTLMPFEHEQTDPATADAMTVRMVFSGAGSEIATAEQIAEIEEFASLLYAEMTQE
jgi:hypothetical protein